jgi:hypothetical protein
MTEKQSDHFRCRGHEDIANAELHHFVEVHAATT